MTSEDDSDRPDASSIEEPRRVPGHDENVREEVGFVQTDVDADGLVMGRRIDGILHVVDFSKPFPLFGADVTPGFAPIVVEQPKMPITASGVSFDYEPVLVSEERLSSARAEIEGQIDAYYDIVTVTLDSDAEPQEEMLRRLHEAKLMIQEEHDGLQGALGRAQLELKLIHVAIGTEVERQSTERRLHWVVPVIVGVYIALIVAVVVLFGRRWTVASEIPVVGVPWSVVLWAAIGSLAAILYRFYTHRPSRLSEEIRWLFARPIIGIIMGAVVYLAVMSGLFIFGGSTVADVSLGTSRAPLWWLVAFLAGFSDKFFEMIIRAVGERFTPQGQGDSSIS